MSEMQDRVRDAILGAFTHIEDKEYRKTIAGCWARAAIEAMSESDEYFTLVFKGDLRAFKGNPFKTDTPFGVPVICGIGNAYEEEDIELSPLRPAGSADLYGVERAEE